VSLHRLSAALFFFAATTLMLELLLTRVFDVILTPNMAYMVISCALFAFGLAGIWVTLRPPSPEKQPERQLRWLALALALSLLALRPSLNLLPFDYEDIPERPLLQAFSFSAMYVVLVVPFFISGLVFVLVFSVHAHRIQTLYFWDLLGAASGCMLIVPLIEPIGPGGILFVAAASALFAAAVLSPRRRFTLATAAAGLALVALPFLRRPDYFDFREHLAKRGVKEARQEGRIEFTRWDPISKIDVFDQTSSGLGSKVEASSWHRKHVAYDGGTQSSHIYPFDGDYRRLRSALERGEEPLWAHFWHRGVLASHYLKRDTGSRVLIIGSAAGQETKAALLYGASRVDAVEMVGVVVRIGLGRYAEYNGGLFHDPRVSVHVDEGRSFLRRQTSPYDIIQIHSNHTSSSIAAGTGALSPAYLQTTDAYRQFFTHLSTDGLLHVNHHVFARMITTAALAWKELGRDDFQRHVVVFGIVGVKDTLPTFLVKMTPWTDEEVSDLERFFAGIGEGELPYELLQDPRSPADSFLPPAFFSGALPRDVAQRTAFNVLPTTDDRPFFNLLRKRLGRVEPDPERHTDLATALILNSQLRKGIPMDVVHLAVTAAVSLFFAFVFVGVPLYGSEVGRARWPSKTPSVVYFSCLGAGFILFELVLIQVLMKLIGYPVHTYALVIFTLLLGAGVGSAASSWLGITPHHRWAWPFAGIAGYGLAFILGYPTILDQALAASDAARMLAAALLVLPLGFFLGMPFPLGILALEGQPKGAIAWAWGLNGLFTVVGSLASVILGVAVGFRLTLVAAVATYVLAALTFSRLRRVAPEAAGGSGQGA
jgi:spermidine synthase